MHSQIRHVGKGWPFCEVQTSQEVGQIEVQEDLVEWEYNGA